MDGNLSMKLSADITMHILSFLDPVDILAMRSTCRAFYRTAASKSVWIAALTRVCEMHGVYKPTYPMENMTLAELEHAASGPHRFMKFVSNFELLSPTTSTDPYLTREFRTRTKSNEAGKAEGSHSVSQLVVVPGGRFLVTVQNRTNDSPSSCGTACLWDLGYNMNAPLTPFPIATVAAPANVRKLSVCPSLDGKDIIVAMQGYDGPPNKCLVTVCSIDPLQRTPEFVVHMKQSLESIGRTASICLNEPIIVVKSGFDVVVWNWREETGCRWGYPPLDYSADILLCEKTIVAVDDLHDFVIWDIPDHLSPVIPQQDLPLIINPPKRIRRMHVAESDLPTFSVAVTPSWQRHTDPYFCVVVDEQDDAGYDNRVFLHSLRKTGSREKAFVPTYLPVETGECYSLAEDVGDEFERAISPLILCDGRLVLCSRSTSNEIVASVLPVATEQTVEGVIKPRSAFLLQGVEEDNISLDYDNVGFCPFSGRLVATRSDTSLQILDFLLPIDERHSRRDTA